MQFIKRISIFKHHQPYKYGFLFIKDVNCTFTFPTSFTTIRNPEVILNHRDYVKRSLKLILNPI